MRVPIQIFRNLKANIDKFNDTKYFQLKPRIEVIIICARVNNLLLHTNARAKRIDQKNLESYFCKGVKSKALENSYNIL